MGKVLGFFEEVIKSCNVFTAPVNLRYKQDPDYNTVTGGFTSIGLIILLVSVFYNAWMELLNKEAISSTREVIREFDPEQVHFNSDNFMFAMGISGLNLSDMTQKQFFSLKMKMFTITNSPTYSKVATSFNLQPCTRNHWQQLGDEFVETYESMKLSAFLCPPRNTTIDIAGKYTSTSFIYYKVEVGKCSKNCRTQAELDAWTAANSTFSFNFYYSNTLINPDQTKPLSTFFQDKDYTVFSTAMYTSTNIYVGKYVMETDQSIFPWVQTNVQEGFIVNRQEKQSWNFMAAASQPYCKLYIRKSNMRIEIQRSFRKIDDMLSYIGGLFGIITVAVGFIMNYYSQCSFQLEMCQNIFDYHNKKSGKDQINQNTSDISLINQSQSSPMDAINKSVDGWSVEDKAEPQEVIEPKQFGFLDFLLHAIYIPFNKICNLQWKRMEVYAESLQEMRNKLDVSQLLEKLSFYDRSINVLFDENQLKLLYLQQKFNFQEIRQQREFMGMRKDIIANLFGMVATDILPIPEQPFEKKKSLKQIAECHSRNKLKTFMGKSVNVLDLFAQMAPKDTSSDSGQEINLPDDIKKALKKLDQNIQKGDVTSIRIYNGLQYDLLQAFEKSKMKKTKHRVANKKSQQRRLKDSEIIKKDLPTKEKIMVVNFTGEDSASSICNFNLR